MITHTEARQLVDDLFEEEALALGGLVAIHEVPDDLVWRFVKSLDTIRGRVLRRLEAEDPGDDPGDELRSPNLQPHPAIQEFLAKIRRS